MIGDIKKLLEAEKEKPTKKNGAENGSSNGHFKQDSDDTDDIIIEEDGDAARNGRKSISSCCIGLIGRSTGPWLAARVLVEAWVGLTP